MQHAFYFRRIQAQAHGGCFDQFQQGRIFKAIIDIASGPIWRDQPGLAQEHQMLRDDRLAHAGHRLQVADTGFAFADGQQDLDADWLTDQLEQIRKQQQLW